MEKKENKNSNSKKESPENQGPESETVKKDADSTKPENAEKSVAPESPKDSKPESPKDSKPESSDSVRTQVSASAKQEQNPKNKKNPLGLEPVQLKTIIAGVVGLIVVLLAIVLFSGESDKPKEFQGTNSVNAPSSSVQPELFGWEKGRWYGYYISFKPPRNIEEIDSVDYGNFNENINFDFPKGSASVFVYSKAAYSKDSLKEKNMNKLSNGWLSKETNSGQYKITSLLGTTKNLTISAQIVEAINSKGKYTKPIQKGLVSNTKEKNAKKETS